MASPKGSVQIAILNWLEKTEYEFVLLGSMGMHPEFHNVSFKRMQSAAKALAKKGLIRYERFCEVSLI